MAGLILFRRDGLRHRDRPTVATYNRLPVAASNDGSDPHAA